MFRSRPRKEDILSEVLLIPPYAHAHDAYTSRTDGKWCSVTIFVANGSSFGGLLMVMCRRCWSLCMTAENNSQVTERG